MVRADWNACLDIIVAPGAWLLTAGQVASWEWQWFRFDLLEQHRLGYEYVRSRSSWVCNRQCLAQSSKLQSTRYLRCTNSGTTCSSHGLSWRMLAIKLEVESALRTRTNGPRMKQEVVSPVSEILRARCS